VNSLLDTPAFIWATDDDPKLSANAWSMIEEANAAIGALAQYSELVHQI
jgi:PIN domain nuclease of toxin-antitoxin system